jgi:hypothetical protein
VYACYVPAQVKMQGINGCRICRKQSLSCEEGARHVHLALTLGTHFALSSCGSSPSRPPKVSISPPNYHHNNSNTCRAYHQVYRRLLLVQTLIQRLPQNLCNLNVAPRHLLQPFGGSRSQFILTSQSNRHSIHATRKVSWK